MITSTSSIVFFGERRRCRLSSVFMKIFVTGDVNNYMRPSVDRNVALRTVPYVQAMEGGMPRQWQKVAVADGRYMYLGSLLIDAT